MPTPLTPAAVPLLLDWYRQNRRDLPWRESRDPYRVLVSEIMLQQTRAETVKPYFHRFLATLPTVEALAEEHPEILVGKVNVDEEAELAIKYGVRSIPTLLFFEKGQLVNRMVGVQDKEDIETALY